MIKSKALEINLASYHVDVYVAAKYNCIEKVLSQYAGLTDTINVLLKEIEHPYKNWQFIINEMTIYALEYFYLFRHHKLGTIATQVIIEIFISAIESNVNRKICSNAADSLVRYLNCIISESDDYFFKFFPAIYKVLSWMKSCKSEHFFYFVRSYYSLIKVCERLANHKKLKISNYYLLSSIMLRYFRHTYCYWLSVKNPVDWLKENVDFVRDRNKINYLFKEVSHDLIKGFQEKLTFIENNDNYKNFGFKSIFDKLLKMPDYTFFVKYYKKLSQSIVSNIGNANANKWKIMFLFHSMSIPGLSQIHENLLMDISRTVNWLIDNESYNYVEHLIGKTFVILKNSASYFPATTLSCVLTIGKDVYKTNQIDLVDLFINHFIRLGFQAPMVSGVGDDWQLRINNFHLENIRVCLQLIELKPKWSKRLLSYLIINLSVSGIFIRDNDLFPNDITRFLNSAIGPVYNLSKQLTRLFPAYFSDIGAEGSLREISTKLDEVTNRRDVLIHFLRKQTHVESSYRIVRFVESIIKFWETKDKENLKFFLPPFIFSRVKVYGRYVDGVNKIISFLKSNGLRLPEDLIFGLNKNMVELIDDLDDVDSLDVERVTLIFFLYKLLYDKYELNFRTLHYHIDQLELIGFSGLNQLKQALKETNLKKRIYHTLEFLDKLKIIILSDEKYDARSEIYKKRHFAVDIPSTYGSYYELKFAALGLTFRIESLVNALFEELSDKIDLDLITKATFYQIYDQLTLFEKALKIDGVYSVEFGRQLDFLSHSLEVREFTFTQYMDIFKGFNQAVSNMVSDYFNNIHGHNLTHILSRLSSKNILSKYFSRNSIISNESFSHRVSEIFFRDLISMSLGIQQLDIFLSRIHNTIFSQSNKLPKDDLQLLLNYDPQCAVTSLDGDSKKAIGIIYMGSKGLNMQKLSNLGLPIPPCFIVTTEAFRCRYLINCFEPAKKNFEFKIMSHIFELQRKTGKIFGNHHNPMLLSVRSGSSVSQPGMMDTFVNVGINNDIIEGMIEKNGDSMFAWDSYRRFLECCGTAQGLKRDDFDEIVREFKDLFNVPHKKVFSGYQMKALTLAFKSRIQQHGIEIPDNPIDQLNMAINSVFASWESQKARAYRSIMGISDDWGTAVLVQDMVYGNVSRNSGSGVFFTHNPRWYGDSLSLWGDFTLCSQGGDVVSGLVKTFPISVKQQEIELRDTDITLETHFPDIYNAIEYWAKKLVYKERWGPQEMEFTFESPEAKDLYLLQTRDMSIREHTRRLKFFSSAKQINNCLGRGIGVSGGAMSGRVVFTLEDVEYWRVKDPGISLILMRRDTVPDDIEEIFSTDGLLTSKGGVTSHAAVVAHRLGKTCVVGCGYLVCNERDKIGVFSDIVIRSGDYISIDGHDGFIYLGKLEIIYT